MAFHPVIASCREYFDLLESDQVSLDQPLSTIPGWTSLSFCGLIHQLENDLQIRLDPIEFLKCETLREVSDLVQPAFVIHKRAA